MQLARILSSVSEQYPTKSKSLHSAKAKYRLYHHINKFPCLNKAARERLKAEE